MGKAFTEIYIIVLHKVGWYTQKVNNALLHILTRPENRLPMDKAACLCDCFEYLLNGDCVDMDPCFSCSNKGPN